MLLDSQMNLPAQDAGKDEEFPMSSRCIKKWINSLPYVDQNAAAQKFYDGLRRSNRQAHTAKQRLDAIELMRPVAHEFLQGQRKYLLAQTFPLSKKASEFLKLQQNIISELAVAYKIIIRDAINKGHRISKKKMLVCLHRAMRYMLDQYITLSQVYSEPPQGYWQDFSQLYKTAEQLKIEENQIDDIGLSGTVKSSPNCLFKQVCILSLSNLHTLGHGEAERVATFIESKSYLFTLSDKKYTDEYIYTINLILNTPPRLIADEDLPISSENRFINIEKLILELREDSTSQDNETAEAVIANSEISKSLAERLLKKITYKPNRTAKRVCSYKNNLNVVLGLRNTVDVLSFNAAEISEEKTIKETLKLDSIELKRDEFGTVSPIDHGDDLEDSSGNAWDWVGRGNVVTGAIDSTTFKLKKDPNNSSSTLKPVIQVWEISNASNGGYCLQSTNTSDYQSQVGDLVCLKQAENKDDTWRLGAIRWMQSLVDNGVKIGIQTLAGKIRVIDVMDAHFSQNKFKGLEQILLLEEDPDSESPATLIAPPNSIKQGEKLEVYLQGNAQIVEFVEAVEKTISYVRFTFKSTQIVD